MSETWDDYYSSDPAAAADTSVTESTDTATVDPAVASDLDSAAVADDWSNWNAETSQEASSYADSSLDAGNTALEQGDTELASYDFNIADNEATVADDHGSTADDYAATADSYATEAAGTAELDSSDGSDSSYDS